MKGLLQRIVTTSDAAKKDFFVTIFKNKTRT